MTSPPTDVRRVLWLVPAVYFIFVAAEFAAMTHLALSSTAAGRSALAVGLLATSMWGGILVSSSLAHRAVARLGHARVFLGGTSAAWLALLSMAWQGVFALWLIGALVLGLGGGMVWVAGEAWLAEAAPPDRRGFFVGLFETSVGLGLMTGPLLVRLSQATGLSALWLAVALMALALVTCTALRRAPGGSASAAAPAAAAQVARAESRRVALPLAAVALASGLMESGVSALLPSVSMRLGFSLEAAAWLGTVIGAGSALLQPPAGHLADRIGVRRAALGAWGVVIATNAALLVFAGQPGVLLWVVGFTLGGVGGAVYTLLIVDLGHRLSGAALVQAIGILVIGYAAGTTIGPTLGGAVFDALGLHGLAGLLLATAMAGLGVAWSTLQSPPAARAAEAARPDR